MDREYLRILLDIDGVESPFMVGTDKFEINEFVYTSQRMGTKTIECSIDYWLCLDDYWTGREYVTFRGERFYLLRTPSSSKSTSSERYHHSLLFESEEDILLSNVYFYDGVVSGEDPTTIEKYHSYNSKFVFYGTLEEFCGRLNAVLAYRGLQFNVQLDSSMKGVTEAKMASFDDKTIFEALQYAYELWEVPFYRNGSDIVFGASDSDVIDEVFEYGVENELISVEKNNESSLCITSITGHGGSKNIPYYYPNETPKGEVQIRYNGVKDGGAIIINPVLFAERFPENEQLVYHGANLSEPYIDLSSSDGHSSGTLMGKGSAFTITGVTSGCHIPLAIQISAYLKKAVPIKINIQYASVSDGELYAKDKERALKGIHLEVKSIVQDNDAEKVLTFDREMDVSVDNVVVNGKNVTKERAISYTIYPDENTSEGRHTFTLAAELNQLYPALISNKSSAETNQEQGLILAKMSATVIFSAEGYGANGWIFENSGLLLQNPYNYGFQINNDVPSDGDVITQYVVPDSFIASSEYLLPPIYRENKGLAPFYFAINDLHAKAEGGYYEFDNTYSPVFPREYIQNFEDIYPTIKGTEYRGVRIDQIADIFLEDGFNTVDVDSEGNYAYSSFFIKLRPLGFNLFKKMSAKEEMTIEMTSGDCAASKFKILVSDNRNAVQVDADGNLVIENGHVLESSPMDVQNDTTDNSVWLRVQIDTSTYGNHEGGAMPNYKPGIGGQKPKTGDEFVITGIDLPQYYITAAEERLKHALLKFMEDNNSEKFTFSIGFSRIELAQKPQLRDAISERSALKLRYNGVMLPYPLYVTQYTYRATLNEYLPEISVELKDKITVTQNTIDRKIASVFEGFTRGLGASRGIQREDADKRYILKNFDDKATGIISFLKGAKFGDFKAGIGGKGASVSIDEYGYSRMELDFLNVRKLAEFTEIQIDKISSVGGKILVSMANMVCTGVEPVDAYETESKYKKAFRCYFDEHGDNGNPIVNQFKVGDLAICQSFNLGHTQFYWRLVIGVEANAIILSDEQVSIPTEGSTDETAENIKLDFLPGSTVPQKGDNIVQLGNRTDPSRQSAQIISCYGEDTPSLTMYAGIDDFSLAGKDVFGVVVKREIETVISEDEQGNTVTSEITRYRPKLYNYGDMYMGDRPNEEGNASAYLSYDSKKKQMVLRGVINQAADGTDTTVVPRGEFSPNRLYIKGDLVTYEGSAYRCIKDYPADGLSLGITPENAEYWSLYIAGGQSAPGEKGNGVHIFTGTVDDFQKEKRGLLSDTHPSNVIIGDTVIASNGDVYVVTDVVGAYWYADPSTMNIKGDTGAPGAPGAPGDTGAPGQQGLRGFNGCIHRLTVWEPGKLYRNDEALDPSNEDDAAQMSEDGLRYVDIVTNVPMAIVNGEYTGFSAFYCKKTHVSDSSTNVLEEGVNWGRMNAMAPIVTPLLIAKKIHADMLDCLSIAAVEGFFDKLQSSSFTSDLINVGFSTSNIVITGQSIELKDNDGNPVMLFGGGSRYNSVADFAADASSKNISVSSGSVTESKTFFKTSEVGEQTPDDKPRFDFLSRELKTVATGISLPSCNVAISGLSFSGPSFSVPGRVGIGDTGDIEVTMVLENQANGLKQVIARQRGSIKTINNVAVTAGTYSIGIYLGGQYDYTCMGSDATGTVTYSSSSFTLVCRPLDQHTEVFANGIGYKRDNVNYHAVVGTSEGMEFGTQRSDGTKTYGASIDSNGLCGSPGNGVYSPMMCVLLAGYVSASGDVTVSYSALGITSATASVSSSQYTIQPVFPARSSDGFGSTTYTVLVTSDNSSSGLRFHKVVSKSLTSFKVSSVNANNNSYDCGFEFAVIGKYK